MRGLIAVFGLLAGLGAPLAAEGESREPLAGELERFWAAESPGERGKIGVEIALRGYAIDDVLAHLRRGRPYTTDVPTGRLLRERAGVDGRRHPYMILIPPDYRPDRRWWVRFDLHGGMGADEWKELDGSWSPGWRETRGHIVVVPAGWWDSMWWEWSQVENFEAILREVRQTWNIDPDRVVLYGASDGGAALFFHAMRQPDRWAGYAGHIAPPDRLVRADFRPDGQMHVSNLAGQRFHLGYGELDRKVPLQHVEKYMALFERHGALLDWYVVPGQGHGLRLDADREQQLWEFLVQSRRDPLPDTLSWATETTDRYARRQWLVIEKLTPCAGTCTVDASNILPRWGTPIQLRGPAVKHQPWGRVTLRRDGNRVTARSVGVERFRLLLSPDEFDLSQPVKVELNGRNVFDRKVERSLATLLKWAAVDDDPSRLFVAEISIEVDPG